MSGQMLALTDMVAWMHVIIPTSGVGPSTSINMWSLIGIDVWIPFAVVGGNDVYNIGNENRGQPKWDDTRNVGYSNGNIAGDSTLKIDFWKPYPNRGYNSQGTRHNY